MEVSKQAALAQTDEKEEHFLQAQTHSKQSWVQPVRCLQQDAPRNRDLPCNPIQELPASD